MEPSASRHDQFKLGRLDESRDNLDVLGKTKLFLPQKGIESLLVGIPARGLGLTTARNSVARSVFLVGKPVKMYCKVRSTNLLFGFSPHSLLSLHPSHDISCPSVPSAPVRPTERYFRLHDHVKQHVHAELYIIVGNIICYTV